MHKRDNVVIVDKKRLARRHALGCEKWQPERLIPLGSIPLMKHVRQPPSAQRQPHLVAAQEPGRHGSVVARQHGFALRGHAG
jgi:hypothetical protein